jgi:hypothetical protein
MKQPSFLEGVAIALAASLIGSILFSALAPLLGGGTTLRLLIAGIGFGYLIYLLNRAQRRTGRVSLVAFWVLLAGLLGALELPLLPYLLAHLFAIWLVRCLYFYSGLLPALADLGLSGLSLAAGIWAFSHSGSLFLTIWSLLLTQALFVAIPPRIGGDSAPRRMAEDPFERAHRNAQAALNRIVSTR